MAITTDDNEDIGCVGYGDGVESGDVDANADDDSGVYEGGR